MRLFSRYGSAVPVQEFVRLEQGSRKQAALRVSAFAFRGRTVADTARNPDGPNSIGEVEMFKKTLIAALLAVPAVLVLPACSDSSKPAATPPQAQQQPAAQEPTQQVRAESTQAAPATEGQTATATPAAEQSQSEGKPDGEKKPEEEKKPQ
jgi:hypothetical protein